jgi:plasmid stabilization system protein ParE
MVEQKWRVRLSAAAELDFAYILKWTADNFGALQARIYRDALDQAIDELTDSLAVLKSRVPRTGTRSCEAFERSTLLDVDGVGVIFWHILRPPNRRSRSCASSMTEWICNARCRLASTKAASSLRGDLHL